MTFAAYARWAVPRNINCSTFNRRIAANMQLNRGLAASPLLRLAAEPRPLGGFVEQRGAVPLGGARPKLGEELDDTSPTEALASILNGITDADAAVCTSFTEMLELSVLGIYNGRCWG
mmetsp:Transcript_44132/g.141475  ORF Transcript_44132/g.141475 Transcript_44132/m.141475 type:complete len:118 (-) Transcript_44132:99-452(-)